jgi:MoxR-like ATPase
MAKANIKIVQALDRLRTHNYYVHNDLFDGLAFESAEIRRRPVYLVETLATINALVENGTMLLYGGHGGGKTTLSKFLGQIFCRFSSDEIEDCFLRCHPQLTEEKILGSLDIAQLTGNRNLTHGKYIDVHWSKFVESPWKIIDELNRLSPYAQNILLSLLAEGSVKYHNSSKRLSTYSVYATMNPKAQRMKEIFLCRFLSWIGLPWLFR